MLQTNKIPLWGLQSTVKNICSPDEHEVNYTEDGNGIWFITIHILSSESLSFQNSQPPYQPPRLYMMSSIWKKTLNYHLFLVLWGKNKFVEITCRLEIKERLAFSTLCHLGLFPPFTIHTYNFVNKKQDKAGYFHKGFC